MRRFGVPLNSSACEDIDSIDPLVRFSFVTDYRKEDIYKPLRSQFRGYLSTPIQTVAGSSAGMKPFSMAMNSCELRPRKARCSPAGQDPCIGLPWKAIGNSQFGSYSWSHANCPGHQFWRPQVPRYES